MDAGPRGIATADGFSLTMGSMSSTSNTRSNDTSAIITSTCMLERAVRGWYRRPR